MVRAVDETGNKRRRVAWKPTILELLQASILLIPVNVDIYITKFSAINVWHFLEIFGPFS